MFGFGFDEMSEVEGEGSAAEDIHDLASSADAEDGFMVFFGVLKDGIIDAVAVVVGVVVQRGFFSVELRVYIGDGSDKEESVAEVGEFFDEGGHGNDERDSAGLFDRLDISSVNNLLRFTFVALACDSNHGTLGFVVGHDAGKVLGGNSALKDVGWLEVTSS